MRRLTIFMLAALAGTGAVHAAPVSERTSPATPAWLDRSRPPQDRARALAAQMTQQEKLALVHGHFPPKMEPRPADVPLIAGYAPGVPRLGIPALRESDASLGIAANKMPWRAATAFPSGLAQAASWDPELARSAGAAIGAQARASGFNVMLAGGINLTREPRGGRNFEYMGEDPLLAGVMAGNVIRGIQSQKVASTIKHFAINAQETGRMVLDVRMDLPELRESDLLAFEKAIEIGRPASVMCSYNRINGDYGCENAALFRVLKDDWGYPGWVMSDWGAVHSTWKAAVAGLDQESGQELDKQVFFGPPLAQTVSRGDVAPARLDDMVVRILHGMIASGIYDNPVAAGTPDLKAGGVVARRAAADGMVLLRNEHDVLPLAARSQRIAVIGGHADKGVYSGGGSSQVIPERSVRLAPPPYAPAWGAGVILHPDPPLDAIRASAPGAKVSFDDGTDPARAAAVAREADVAIVFAHQWTSEAMDAPLELQDGQDALIAAVAAANPKTVVILETGGAVFMPWLDRVSGVLEAWYPGSSGGQAIADVLFGRVNPAGKLPITFPANGEQLPNRDLPGEAVRRVEGSAPDTSLPAFEVRYPEGPDAGYRWFARQVMKPLFPFGHGLSYTTFTRSKPIVDQGSLTVTFNVTNSGNRAGSDVAQVYMTPPGRAARLVAWEKVSLAPGETRPLKLPVDPRFLATYDESRHSWIIQSGDYGVSVEGWQATPAASIRIYGRTMVENGSSGSGSPR